MRIPTKAAHALLTLLLPVTLLGPVLGEWAHHHELASIAELGHGATHETSLHSSHCGHEHPLAPHDPATCATCRTLQQSHYALADRGTPVAIEPLPIASSTIPELSYRPSLCRDCLIPRAPPVSA